VVAGGTSEKGNRDDALSSKDGLLAASTTPTHTGEKCDEDEDEERKKERETRSQDEGPQLLLLFVAGVCRFSPDWRYLQARAKESPKGSIFEAL
jgi:hypothetical protein